MQHTLQELITILNEHNEWRRGGDGEMIDPKVLGAVIEQTAALLKALEPLLDTCETFSESYKEMEFISKDFKYKGSNLCVHEFKAFGIVPTFGRWKKLHKNLDAIKMLVKGEIMTNKIYEILKGSKYVTNAGDIWDYRIEQDAKLNAAKAVLLENITERLRFIPEVAYFLQQLRELEETK